jgi:hypothetical protein
MAQAVPSQPYSRRVVIAGLLLAPATLLMIVMLSFLTGAVPGNIWFAAFTWSFEGVGFLYYLLPVVFFYALGATLFSGAGAVPAHSLAALILAAVGVALYFVKGWSFGVKYQDYLGLVVVAYLNVGVFALLSYLALRSRFRPSFARNLAFHWLFVWWLASGAFPYMGELL